jgi:hypothetical protein
MVSAKRSVLMPEDVLALPGSMKGAVGAGSPTKWAPPSVVRTIEVHTGLLHGASPRSQYWLADIAVKDSGSKPEGTAPPAGWPPATVLSVTAWVVGAGVEGTVVVAVTGTVVGAAVVGGLVVGAPALETVGVLETVAGAVVDVVLEAAWLPPPQPATSAPPAKTPIAKTGANIHGFPHAAGR